MDMPKPGLGPYFKRINDSLAREVNRSLKASDLTCTQSHLLLELYHRENHTAALKELESRFQVSQPTIAGLVSRLEAKQLILSFADPSDRRVKRVRLTEKGEAVCLASQQEILAVEARLARSLTEEEHRTLLTLLRKVCNDIT